MSGLQIALVIGCFLAGLLVVPGSSIPFSPFIAIGAVLSVVIGPLLAAGT